MRNPYSLPLGYVLEDDWEANWVMTDSNPANVQNDLSRLLGFGDILVLEEESRFEKSDYNVSCTLADSGEYFIFIGNSNVDKVTLHIDEIAYQKNFENLKRRFFIEAGYLNGGTKLRISHDQEGDIIPKIYRVDEFVLGQIYDKLSRQVFDPGSVKDNEISGRMRSARLRTRRGPRPSWASCRMPSPSGPWLWPPGPILRSWGLRRWSRGPRR